MKLLKRLIVIAVIAAFATIAGNMSSDYSCSCGDEQSHPFSILVKIFEKYGENTSSNNHEYESDFRASILTGIAFAQKKSPNFKVTFIELGSVNCIPCRTMQPVMKQIEEKYEDQVKIIFYDVWTEKGRPFAYKYGIQAIPTQVYLDSSGKEFFRHVGFHPFEEIEKILKKAGVR